MQHLSDAKTLTAGGYNLAFSSAGVRPGKAKKKVEQGVEGTVQGWRYDGTDGPPAISATLKHTDSLPGILDSLYAQEGLIVTVETTGGGVYTLDDAILAEQGEAKGGEVEVVFQGASLTPPTA